MMFWVHNPHNQKLIKISSTTLTQPNLETRKSNRLKYSRTQTLSLLCFQPKIWKTGSPRNFFQYNYIHHLLNNVRIKSAQFLQIESTQTENIELTKTMWHITYTSSSLLPCSTPEGIERKEGKKTANWCQVYPKLCTQNRIWTDLSAPELRRGIFHTPGRRSAIGRMWEQWRDPNCGVEEKAVEAKRRREEGSGFFLCPDLLPERAGSYFPCFVRRGRARASTFLPAGRVSYLLFCPLPKGSSSGKCEWGPPVGYSPRVVKLDLGSCTTLRAYSSIHLGPSTWRSTRG